MKENNKKHEFKCFFTAQKNNTFHANELTKIFLLLRFFRCWCF